MGTHLNPVTHPMHPPQQEQDQPITITMQRLTGPHVQQQSTSTPDQQSDYHHHPNQQSNGVNHGDEEKLIDGSGGYPPAANSAAAMLFSGRKMGGDSSYSALVSHGRDYIRSLCSSRPSTAMAASCLAFFALLFVGLIHVARTGPFSHFEYLPSADIAFHPPASSNTVTSPSFNCSELGLKEEKTILEEQQYHVFPTSEMGIQSSCQSRYQQHCFRKNTGPKHHPSREFLSALREYEAYHERCTRGFDLTDLANKGDAPQDCSYLVWKTMDGMGNQLLSLVSAFIYSLLTNRVLLIGTDSHLEQYLCNPFPLSSWAIPEGFPANALRDGSQRLFDYLNAVMAKRAEGSACSSSEAGLSELIAQAPSRITVYIICCDKGRDHQFFCPTAQKLLRGVNWVFYQSHEYTLPAFYFVPEFREKLKAWFPNNDVFMHGARYLLNPQNEIWERITAVYRAHMDGKGKQVGLQPRSWTGDYLENVNSQIKRCAVEEKLLPRTTLGAPIETGENRTEPAGGEISVLVASLRAEYAGNLGMEYAQHATEDGSRVSVFSASSEGLQKTGDASHDITAITDIWLLSFAHELVITPRSTFGSTASGMGGLVPFVFVNYEQNKLLEPACARSNLAGPCFLVYPANQPCDLDPPRASIFDPGFMIPEVKYCDHNPGLGIQNI